MCNNPKKKPKLLTDAEVSQVSGGVSEPVTPSTKPVDGVYIPDTSRFVLVGGTIQEKQRESGGVYVPDTSRFVLAGGAIQEKQQESGGVP